MNNIINKYIKLFSWVPIVSILVTACSVGWWWFATDRNANSFAETLMYAGMISIIIGGCFLMGQQEDEYSYGGQIDLDKDYTMEKMSRVSKALPAIIGFILPGLILGAIGYFLSIR